MIKYILFAAILVSCHSKRDNTSYKIVYHPNDTFRVDCVYVGSGENSFNEDTSLYKASLQRIIDSLTGKEFVIDGDYPSGPNVSPYTGYAYKLANAYGWDLTNIPISGTTIRESPSNIDSSNPIFIDSFYILYDLDDIKLSKKGQQTFDSLRSRALFVHDSLLGEAIINTPAWINKNKYFVQ